MLYGVEVWGRRLQEKHVKALGRVQRALTSTMLGAGYQTPTAFLDAEAQQLPMRLNIAWRVAKFAARTATAPSGRGREVAAEHFVNAIPTAPPDVKKKAGEWLGRLGDSYTVVLPWQLDRPWNVEVEIAAKREQSIANANLLVETAVSEQRLLLFSDGSLDREMDSVGYGAVAYFGPGEPECGSHPKEVGCGAGPLPACCNIMQAELEGISMAVGLAESYLASRADQAEKVDGQKVEVCLFVDSQPAIMAVRKGHSDINYLADRQVWRVREELRGLAEHPEVRALRMIWVNSHKGVKGNERADKLAEEGRKCVLEGEALKEAEARVPGSLAEVLLRLKELISAEWQRQLTTVAKKEGAKGFLPCADLLEIRKFIKECRLILSRVHNTIASRLRTGFGWMKSRHDYRPRKPVKCGGCKNTVDDLRSHWLVGPCPALEEEQAPVREFLGLRSGKPPRDTHFERLLGPEGIEVAIKWWEDTVTKRCQWLEADELEYTTQLKSTKATQREQREAERLQRKVERIVAKRAERAEQEKRTGKRRGGAPH